LRRGGALTMALSGVPDRVIRQAGRWKSYCYRTYIDLTMKEKSSWAKRVAKKLKCESQGVEAGLRASVAAADLFARLKR